MRVSLEEFTQIRTGLLASLGLADRLPETADGRFL
jgi:hypothetical protein